MGKPMDDLTAQDLYDAFAYAETGAYKDPFIRTHVSPTGGSTAFGPVQITGTKLRDYVDRGLVSTPSKQFATSVMLPMQAQFAYYGNEPKKKGYSVDFDYGGNGGFDVAKHGENYRNLAKDMLFYDYHTSDKNIDKAIEKWRGTSSDKAYNKKVKEKISQILKLRAMDKK